MILRKNHVIMTHAPEDVTIYSAFQSYLTGHPFFQKAEESLKSPSKELDEELAAFLKHCQNNPGRPFKVGLHLAKLGAWFWWMVSGQIIEAPNGGEK